MSKPEQTHSRDYLDFRFRLRHDQLLRHQLRRAKQEAVIAMARELGFKLSIDDLQNQKQKSKKRKAKIRKTSSSTDSHATTRQRS